jgi:hypothetical protein
MKAVAHLSEQHELFHVTLTVGGIAMEPALVQAACQRLSSEQPFLFSGRFGADRAEVHYWEEAPDCAAAKEFALQLWDNHRESAGLPPWAVLGVDVIDRDTFLQRGGRPVRRSVTPAGTWRPF